MEVFGKGWENYVERILKNWNETVNESDTVLIGGDVSWEMRLQDCVSDFSFIHNLPGRKIILKGNHDYWWDTAAKLRRFTIENGFDDIEFLQNNAAFTEEYGVCGTRWWNDPTSPEFKKDDLKIYNREIIRLENSLAEAKKAGCEKIIAVLHYPPFDNGGNVNSDVKRLFEEYNVAECVYGHLHGNGLANAAEGKFNATNYHLTSADYLDFCPIRINF